MADRVEINETEYRAEFETADGMVGRDLDARAARVQRGAQAQVGVQTGGLKRSITRRWTSRTGPRLTVQVGSTVRHALVHHEGSRPHIIRARTQRPMRWTNDAGETVFAHSVNHPGTRGNAYLTDNLRLATD